MLGLALLLPEALPRSNTNVNQVLYIAKLLPACSHALPSTFDDRSATFLALLLHLREILANDHLPTNLLPTSIRVRVSVFIYSTKYE